MANMTMAIEDKMHKRMKVHSEIKWTEVARKAFEKKLKEIEKEEDKDDKAWRSYALKHSLEEWDDADELIEY